MCRLFAQISEEETGAEDFLIRRPHSLLRQSFLHPRWKQKDGWGLAWIQKGLWKTEKSARPVFERSSNFSRLAKKIRSRLILAHVRHASNPKGLPPKELIGVENNQPYTYEGLAFAHNGTLNIPREVARTLGRYRKNIRGNNDSEVLFWLFVKCWNETPAGRGRWTTAFGKMTSKIKKVWKTIPAQKRRHPRPFAGLNVIASNGKELAAHCLFEKADGKSLCGQGRPYFEMCYNSSDGRTVAASEPMDKTGLWTPLRSGHVLVVAPNRRARMFQL